MAGDFFGEFFVKPIASASGYNIFNTLVFAVIGIALMFFVIYPVLSKRIKFDFSFAVSLLPYVLFGSAFRILEESYSNAHLLARSVNPFSLGFYLVTPGIYLLTAGIALVSLGFSLWLSKRIGKCELFFFRWLGLILITPLVVFLLSRITHPIEFFLVFVFAGMIFLVVFGLLKLFRSKLLENKLNSLAFFAQVFDASATFTALSFFSGFREQHVLPSFVMNFFGPVSFVLLKIPIVLLALWFFDRCLKEENLNGFAKIFVLILGFATGLRDVFSIGLTLLN